MRLIDTDKNARESTDCRLVDERLQVGWDAVAEMEAGALAGEDGDVAGQVSHHRHRPQGKKPLTLSDQRLAELVVVMGGIEPPTYGL